MSRIKKIKYKSHVLECIHSTMQYFYHIGQLPTAEWQELNERCLVHPFGDGRGSKLAKPRRYNSPKRKSAR